MQGRSNNSSKHFGYHAFAASSFQPSIFKRYVKNVKTIPYKIESLAFHMQIQDPKSHIRAQKASSILKNGYSESNILQLH